MSSASPSTCSYTSTRASQGDAAPPLASFEDALLSGIAPDGGLYVPCALPELSTEDLHALYEKSDGDFSRLALHVVRPFVGVDELDDASLLSLLRASFASFAYGPSLVAPVRWLGECGGGGGGGGGGGRCPVGVMELCTGPTLAFKDVALQVVARLLDVFLRKRGERANVVVATSGDTGPAAIAALGGLENVHCTVLFPHGLVSARQAVQMRVLAHGHENVTVFEVDGSTSDLLDETVMALNLDSKFKEQMQVLSVNSFNWARVMLQTTYYFHAYFQACKRASLPIGSPVAMALPAGALGSGAAGFLARRMGLPISKLLLSTNRNGILEDLLRTGTYTRPEEMKPTVSPAIDIQVPYNLERLLYYAAGEDSDGVREWMAEFEKNGTVQLPEAVVDGLRESVQAATVSDETTLKTIRKAWYTHGYGIDPHTAVGIAGAEKMLGFSPLASADELANAALDTPLVCFATADPSKFEAAMLQATNKSPALPAAMYRVLDREADARDSPNVVFVSKSEASSLKGLVRSDMLSRWTSQKKKTKSQA